MPGSYGKDFEGIPTQGPSMAIQAHHKSPQITMAQQRSTMRPEAPPPTHPGSPPTIGSRFPRGPCRADHWDAPSTTCLFLEATRPTADNH